VGLAVLAEYQLWLLAAILALYAVARSGVLRRAAAYAGGTLVGILPLLAFQLWAFGSPFHTPYDDYWTEHGVAGRHFATLPSFDNASAFLFDAMGLLVLTPVVVCGLVGGALLYGRGSRAEALVLVGSCVAYGLYFSRLGAFGGLGPPRYLITIVPFAAAGLAVALRTFPLTTIALGAISAFQMVVMTATGPLAAYDGDWLERLARGDVMETAAKLVGVTGGYAIVPFFAAVVVAAVGAALASERVVLTLREGSLAAAAVLGWAVLALRARNDVGAAPSVEYVAAAVVVVGILVALVAAGSRWFPRPRERAHAAPGLGS
jgi:hypothetical protein